MWYEVLYLVFNIPKQCGSVENFMSDFCVHKSTRKTVSKSEPCNITEANNNVGIANVVMFYINMPLLCLSMYVVVLQVLYRDDMLIMIV